MTAVADDLRVSPVHARSSIGLVLALTSAVTFGLAGALASPLLDAGWSAGAVVLIRTTIGALVVLPFGIRAMHGRWYLLGRAWRILVFYGLAAVVGAQFCYFSAVKTMDVGPALLIEYTAPVAVVVWLWLRHGHRPGRLTIAGAALAALGLMLVLDLFSGADVDAVGAAWSLGAMVGAAAYFLISADDSSGLPPLALASGGLLVGSIAFSVLAIVGALPMTAATTSVTYGDRDLAWWVPLVVLGVVTAAIAYVTGVAATRRLGSRLASFVAMGEVVLAVAWAWLLLGQVPAPVQVLGGVLILGGVVLVKLAEPVVGRPEGTAALPIPS